MSPFWRSLSGVIARLRLFDPYNEFERSDLFCDDQLPRSTSSKVYNLLLRFRIEAFNGALLAKSR